MIRTVPIELEDIMGNSISELCPQWVRDFEANHRAHLASPLAVYGYPVECEREEGESDANRSRLRARYRRARYRIPLRDRDDLSFIDSNFRVDGTVDISSVYGLDASTFQTKWRPSQKF